MHIVKFHNAFCDETIYATVRITNEEFKHFKWFMRLAEPVGYKGKNIIFPFGVELIQTGYGWAKLMPTNFIKGVRKLEFAKNRPFKEYEEYLYQQQLEELRRLMQAELTNTKVVAYSNAHSDGEYVYAAKQEEQVKAKRVEQTTAKCGTEVVRINAETRTANKQTQHEQRLSEHSVAKLSRLASKFGHSLNK